MNQPRVLIADDHFLVAEGLRTLLEPTFEVAAIVTDGEQLVDAAQRLAPDLIVADISMPKLNGLEALQQLRNTGNNAKFVVLTMHSDPVYAARAISFGALAFILKHSAAHELLTALSEALAGRTYIAAELRESVNRLLAAGPEEFNLEQRLTPRQMQVLQLYAQGHSAKEVAKCLAISRRTAENHKASIKLLLGVHSTADLVKLAIRFGLVDPE
jgi:DNA-binding NarL/FixJ family response regulator